MTNAPARIALCALLLAVVAQAETGAQPNPFEISLGTEVGIPRGYVQVRENQLQGTHLSLHGDLGIDTVEYATVAAAYHLTPNDSLRLNFDSIFRNYSPRPAWCRGPAAAETMEGCGIEGRRYASSRARGTVTAPG